MNAVRLAKSDRPHPHFITHPTFPKRATSRSPVRCKPSDKEAPNGNGNGALAHPQAASEFVHDQVCAPVPPHASCPSASSLSAPSLGSAFEFNYAKHSIQSCTPVRSAHSSFDSIAIVLYCNCEWYAFKGSNILLNTGFCWIEICQTSLRVYSNIVLLLSIPFLKLVLSGYLYFLHVNIFIKKHFGMSAGVRVLDSGVVDVDSQGDPLHPDAHYKRSRISSGPLHSISFHIFLNI